MKLKSGKVRVLTAFVVFILLFGSVTTQAEEPFFKDGFEDPPSVVVNSTADGGDILAGDAKCDTGNTIAGGDAECTLRAAIQEVNSGSEVKWILFAIPGLPPHVIQPAIPLPDITRGTASIRGPAMVAGVAQVVVDGSAGGGFSGLVIAATGVQILNLGIRGFDSDGITLEEPVQSTLSSVHISGNCGFGVNAAGPVILDDAGGSPSVIENNGFGNACEGGGIYSASEWPATQPVQVINTTIINNNGPGILSGGPVWLSSVFIEDNIGPGVVAAETLLGNVTIQRNKGQGVFIYQPPGGASGQSVVTASAGINEISGNLGHGIVAERGKVVALRGVELNIRDNAGWGIVMQAGVAELGVNDDEALVVRAISGNGFEEECFEWVYDVVTHSIMPDPFHLGSCHGGGVYSAGVRTTTSFFDATSISGNNGPGILTKARVNLSRSTISENESSGIRVVDADSVTSDTDLMVFSSEGNNELFSNKGHGIHVETGSVEFDESLSMEFNLGFGVLLEQGSVDMLQSSGDAEKSIIQHGPGGPCWLWDIPPADHWISEVVTCSSGGILTIDGNISGRLLIIKTNTGDGLNASGDMLLIDSTVCDNTVSQIVTGGTETLTNVTTVCGPEPARE